MDPATSALLSFQCSVTSVLNIPLVLCETPTFDFSVYFCLSTRCRCKHPVAYQPSSLDVTSTKDALNFTVERGGGKGTAPLLSRVRPPPLHQ